MNIILYICALVILAFAWVGYCNHKCLAIRLEWNQLASEECKKRIKERRSDFLEPHKCGEKYNSTLFKLVFFRKVEAPDFDKVSK